MPLREHEKAQLSGCCYFSLGCTIAITFFPPAISTASILFLVLGDMSAALIGVAFGGESVTIKLGREGKKSVEGSAAMFVVCSLFRARFSRAFRYASTPRSSVRSPRRSRNCTSHSI